MEYKVGLANKIIIFVSNLVGKLKYRMNFESYLLSSFFLLYDPLE